MLSDRLKEIRAAVEASPSKIVVLVTRDHQDNTPGSWHASKLSLPDGSRGWDHTAVAWLDKNGELIAFGEMRIGNGGLGPLGSKSIPGTAGELVTEYGDVQAIPIDLSRNGPGARDAFVKAVSEALQPGKTYSFSGTVGDTCSSAIGKGFAAAAARTPSFGDVLLGFVKSFVPLLGLLNPNLYTPNDAYLDAKKYSVPFTFDPNSTDQGDGMRREWADDVKTKAFELFSDAEPTLFHEARASLQAETGDDAQEEVGHASHDAPTDDATRQPEAERVPLASDPEDARTDGAARQPETDDDEEASQEQVALASDSEDAGTDGAARQPETDDDEEASQEEVALAPDSEVARTEAAAQQPKIDDDEEASQERAALVSDNEDAATDGAGVMETATAEEASVNSTGDDEAAAVPGQPATPASVNIEEGFSFSMFAKQGIPVESDKDTMPAEQVSPAASSTSAMPGSDAADPDVGSEDVGNAAPSKEPVVHHGDLAP